MTKASEPFLHTASLTAWSLHCGTQTSQSNSLAGEAVPGERDEPESGGKRKQGSERAHEESCLLQLHRWCSR